MNDIELSPSLKRRVSEDFDFLVLCQPKGNMGMYRLLGDSTLKADLAAFREKAAAAAAVAAKTQDEDGLMLLKAAVVRAEARREGAVDLDVVVRAIADIEKRRG